MRIFPPDPEVTLYKIGLGEADPYNRKATGRALSDLVERIEDPLVIALDGEWGSGKSYFLKRWVGAHQLENQGKATTVYFDAFANDFLDDPLIALTSVIAERLPEKQGSASRSKLRNAAAALARPVLRIGLAAATAGGTEIAGPIVDAVLDASSTEVGKAAEEFWKKEDGRRAAMDQFRAALLALTGEGSASSSDLRPLVVVVDELDRCRPDYALSLLEVIKHFFNVPNVHFVLGVNLSALEQSVRARYGTNFDAERYLRRFISLVVPLPDVSTDNDQISLSVSYFSHVAGSLGFPARVVEQVSEHVRLARNSNSLTFRDINRFSARLALVDPKRLANMSFGWTTILFSLLMFRSFAPGLERQALAGTLTIADVSSFYGITEEIVNGQDREAYDHQAMLISTFWRFVFSNGQTTEDERELCASAFGSMFGRRAARIPRMLTRDFLDVIICPELEQA